MVNPNESGVGETIEKEEWRDEIVGNLFYPLDRKPKGLIIHMNGSAQVLQDSKSVCLANNGYMVLELGYGSFSPCVSETVKF